MGKETRRWKMIFIVATVIYLIIICILLFAGTAHAQESKQRIDNINISLLQTSSIITFILTCVISFFLIYIGYRMAKFKEEVTTIVTVRIEETEKKLLTILEKRIEDNAKLNSKDLELIKNTMAMSLLSIEKEIGHIGGDIRDIKDKR